METSPLEGVIEELWEQPSESVLSLSTVGKERKMKDLQETSIEIANYPLE